MTNQNTSWRLYSFTNSYLSSIQKSLQMAHCAVDLVRDPVWKDLACVTKWADQDKTMIVLNGGAQPQLEEIAMQLNDFYLEFQFPWQKFYEDAGLNNALTCVSVLIPDHIYDLDLDYIKGLHYTQIPMNFRLKQLISKPLAI